MLNLKFWSRPECILNKSNEEKKNLFLVPKLLLYRQPGYKIYPNKYDHITKLGFSIRFAI